MSTRLMMAALLLSGCAGESSIKPAEHLDERTGVTVGALEEPIELVENSEDPVPGKGKRTSFAYLGPVEWDESGEITYGLWIHVAPGNDKQVGDLRSRGAVTVMLDDGAVVLSPMDAPAIGKSPYRPIASWGQTAYFGLDVALLKRLAASHKLLLDFRGTGPSMVQFTPSHDTHGTLTQFEHARGLNDD